MAMRTVRLNFRTKDDMDEFSSKIFASQPHMSLGNLVKEIIYRKKDIVDIELRKKTTIKNKPLKEWELNWVSMTPFRNKSNNKPYLDCFFSFDEDYQAEVEELLNQPLTNKTTSIFYPLKEVSETVRKRWLGIGRNKPRYPIYVISKGRSKNCITADHLIKLDIDFKIVVEKQELDSYAELYGYGRLLELDMSFRDSFDTYIENFDESKSKGSGPARNFVWDHAKNSGAKWHWIIDDNIFGFYYYDNKERIKAVDGTIFAAPEDFVDRYENIGIAGMNYFCFAIPKTKDRPYVPNTKIYSCLLIRNDLPIRWAGRYNEDVDLCIRALKEGYSTIQFDAFLSDKAATQTVGGGNTDAFYAEEGTLPKSNMLAHNHPDITEVKWRFRRWHHITNYDCFDYYKDRNISDTIVFLNREQLVTENDTDTINEILNIDFSTIKKWNILKHLSEPLRKETIDFLKFYRYLRDSKKILELIMRKRILHCDINEYLWKMPIDNTEDNRIMKDLFSITNKNDVVTEYTDFDSLLSYVEKEKRDIIAKEVMRNKYLLKPEHVQYDYKISEILLTDNEHKNHFDSKNHILNKINNTNLETVSTYFDKKIRKEVKIETKKTFKSKLVSRYDIIEKSDKKVLMVVGDNDFDSELFEDTMNQYKNKYDLFINSVETDFDLLAANYFLDNKLNSMDIVPDKISYPKDYIEHNNKKMVSTCDFCLIFTNTMDANIQSIIDLMKKSNKEYEIVSKTDNRIITLSI